MVAPTSDERREVAARLRTEVSEEECIDYAVCRIINDVLGVNGAWGAKAARILADLIDPTCEVDSIEPVEDELGQTVGYGCIDQHQTCDAVKVEVASTYTLKEMVRNGMGLDQMRKAHGMVNDDLWAWATKCYRSSSYGSMTKPIEVTYHKYQYTLTFNETRGCNTYVTDGCRGTELIEIDQMEEHMVDNLNQWCRVEYLDKLKLAALSELRGHLESAIMDLEKKEQ